MRIMRKLKARLLASAGRRAAFAEDRRGAAAVVMAILLPFLLAGLAFGAELGFWELQRRKVQNAADAAAHAAATQLRQGIDEEDDLRAAALAVAELGGYRMGAAGIALENPPSSGGFAGDNQAILVTLDHVQDRWFSGVFSKDPVVFTVRSTARVENGRPACVLSLAPTAPEAIAAKGSTSVSLGGCDLAANSIASNAVAQQGSATITADCISTVGETSFQNSSNVTLNDCPAPIEHGPLTPDPYRDVPEPSTAAVCATGADKNAFLTNPHKTGTPPPTLDSMTGAVIGKKFCGGGNIQGTTELSSGIYVLSGGNWKVNSGAVLRGDGVTLFLTDGAALDISGGATIDLSAPKTGPWSGLVVYFDRNGTPDSKINGGSNFSMVGAVYGTNTHIEFSGNTTGSGPGECTQVIGYTVTFIGNSGFNTDCSNSGTKEIRSAQGIRIVE
ncbi:TadE/TadG family type IV pilus assembly protein [Amphiplicatus metriothermophilus]|uniref:Flp pilus assembly protein TadG n=1 Tax=Amphiplicatus metriothermophilus TaxID=1519374 RepID=A0A239PLS1_9PROT|nr:TadE/TadG family type IV pilus assembly protein [Amphiplicatus metriothermophilus]MBB5517622.1 Flp pilus assembly protein TadG [Amphiplicatus metriothermophilus]SNT68044.1 Flp pilus assembly protein TadG [Amphiplicatus metriothermophilus]